MWKMAWLSGQFALLHSRAKIVPRRGPPLNWVIFDLSTGEKSWAWPSLGSGPQSTPQARSRITVRNFGLDAMRASAIMLVLFCHSQYLTAFPTLKSEHPLVYFLGGVLGVEI